MGKDSLFQILTELKFVSRDQINKTNFAELWYMNISACGYHQIVLTSIHCFLWIEADTSNNCHGLFRLKLFFVILEMFWSQIKNTYKMKEIDLIVEIVDRGGKWVYKN